jgi:hypothetical protein
MTSAGVPVDYIRNRCYTSSMPDLNIRNISEDLLKGLKVLAAQERRTLREYVLGHLGVLVLVSGVDPEPIRGPVHPEQAKTYAELSRTKTKTMPNREAHHPRCACGICKPSEPISRTQRKRG